MNSAATRKLDYIRAEEKLIQREREAEGEEFADKEKFVTQAYKDQMAEVRLAEVEEKKREGPSPLMTCLEYAYSCCLLSRREGTKRNERDDSFLRRIAQII